MRTLRAFPLLALLVIGGVKAAAYEPDFLNMRIPSRLEAGDLDLLFEHRFYGSVLDNPLQNLFGLSIGANVGFGARWMIIPGLEARGLYTTGGQELSVGAGYGHWFDALPLGVQLNAELVSPQGIDGRGYGVFASVQGQAGPLFKVLEVNVEAAYDSYLNHLGTALGARVDVTPGVAVIAEVYPFFLLGSELHPEQMGAATAFAAGVMLTIGGHQFSLLAGNSFGIGDRQLMAGASAFGGIYLGFNIQRRFP